MTRQTKGPYDYIVVGGGAAGSVVAGELSKTGVEVLLIESGGADSAPTISNPSIWFYNVGGPLDWSLPIAPVPQLNNRKFNMALGHVLGGGSSVNAMVWSRGMDRDYDGWERSGASGWAFKDVLPTIMEMVIICFLRSLMMDSLIVPRAADKSRTRSLGHTKHDLAV